MEPGFIQSSEILYHYGKLQWQTNKKNKLLTYNLQIIFHTTEHQILIPGNASSIFLTLVIPKPIEKSMQIHWNLCCNNVKNLHQKDS